jgi:VIT1/CCC1 family predicted Fe2+/Mn2+ transporter
VWLPRTAALVTAIGLGAAAVGFLIGHLFHTALA